MEAHQQYTEDVKSLIKGIESGYRYAITCTIPGISRLLIIDSNLSTKLIAHLGHARDALHTFSSFDFICKAHEKQESEAGHISMQQVTYVDFATGESSRAIVFGTEIEPEITHHAVSLMVARKLSFNVGLLFD
jgi:hypothetical protein